MSTQYEGMPNVERLQKCEPGWQTNLTHAIGCNCRVMAGDKNWYYVERDKRCGGGDG